MYTMSIIGLILFPLGFFLALSTAEGTINIGTWQVFLMVIVYGFIFSLVGLVHSIRCRKKNKN